MSLVQYLLEFGFGSTLKNMFELSLEVIGNVALPPSPVVPWYTTLETDPKEILNLYKKYEKANLVTYALNTVEGIESSEEPFYNVCFYPVWKLLLSY